jgi:hypothetical protein
MSLQGKHILIILAVAIGLKLAYMLFAFFAANNGVVFDDNQPFKVESFNEKNDTKLLFFRNDAGWYERVAINGHHKVTPDSLKPDSKVWRQSYYAFFPLYPATTAVLQKVFNSNYKATATVEAFVFSLLAFVVFYTFAHLYTKSENTALACTLVLMLFPFGYYYSMALTEAYFFVLLVGSFIAVHRKNIVLMALLSGLLVLVRPNGIITALPLGLYYLELHVFKGKWRLPAMPDFKKLLPGFALLAMPIVFFTYCFYLKEMTGDFFAFSTAQAGWGKAFTNPLLVLFKLKDWRGIVETAFVFAAITIAVVGRKLIPLSMHVLIILSILLPLWAGTTISMPRYISVIFPLFIILGYYLARSKYKPALYTLLGIMHLVSFYFWLKPDILSY